MDIKWLVREKSYEHRGLGRLQRSPFIGGPASEIKKINTLLGARKVEDGKYELRCNVRPSDVTFIFGGTGDRPEA
ncbi:hypothetical protein MRX96_001953 [Rhipicephalus microplus]